MCSDPFRPLSPLKAAQTLPRLTLSHALALLLVALFSLVSYLVLSAATQGSTDTGQIITAGEQRVSGQRIALLASQLGRADDPMDIALLEAQLARALEQFEHLHRLVYTNPAASGTLSQAARALYEQPPYQLNQYIQTYIEHVRTLLTTSLTPTPETAARIDALIAASIPVDVGISRVVIQLRDERRDRIQALLDLQSGMLVATLISLGIVGVVILLPLQRRVRSTVEMLAREIETRAEAEAALAESAARYQSLVDALTEGVLLYDRDGNLAAYNNSAERLLGLSLAQYVGKPTYDPNIHVIYPDGREQERHERPIMHTLTTGEPVRDAVFGFIHDDRPPVWFRINVQPVLRDGRVDGAAVSLTDITESKRVNEELERSRALMQMILDNSPDAIFVVDRQSHILLINPAEARMLGLASPAEAIGKTVLDLYPPALAQRYYESEQAVMASGEIVTDRVEYRKDDQGERWFSVTKVPLRGSDGQVIGMLGLSRDITQRVLTEQQAKALERERDKVEVLSELMSDTSHELRTPLSLINTSLYLLQRTEDPERRVERLQAIEEQVGYLTALLDQMQTMSALDQSGDFALHDVDIPDLLTGLVEGLRPLAEAQQRSLLLKLAPHERPLKANDRQLRFALRNLIENAITFTRAGGRIVVRAFQKPDCTIIEIEDDGIGIAPEQLPHIFDRFYKGDSARSIGRGGVGLGLSIVRRIINIHGGEIAVTSQPEVGSTFRVKLPLYPAGTQPGDPSVQPETP